MVRVLLPSLLRPLADGASEVMLPGAPGSVDEAFALLWRTHPALRDRVLTETGEVREHVQVFVGRESIRFSGGLATALPGDVEVSIVPAVSGG